MVKIYEGSQIVMTKKGLELQTSYMRLLNGIT